MIRTALRGVSLFIATLLVAGLTVGAAGAQKEDDPHYKPVKRVGDREFVVRAPEGSGVVHYFATGSLDGSTTAVRALINISGLLRNSDEYEKTGEEALAAAGAADTILITPQFLAQIDVTGHSLPAATIRWGVRTWLDGLPALGPAPISAFSVLDTIAKRLADRTRFPALREIVFMGHSAGGQLIQRYAVVGKAPNDLAASGLAIRFVVANPSSYLYFDSFRPVPSIEASCPGFNDWKYGMNNVPPYVTLGAKALEARYVTRRVTYMLGMLDTDPNHPVLDKSCKAETQGAYRLARGLSYAQYLRTRHPAGTKHDVAEVAGVDHDARGMFTSTCGVAVIFGRPRTACAENAKI